MQLRHLFLAGLVCAALLTPAVQADVTVTVDPAKPWLGYMNVFDLPVGSGPYLWGSPWGPADLTAVWQGPVLRLGPNTNTYNPADPYWVLPNGEGAKWMNANMYVEDTTLVGQAVTFAGQTILNSFVPGYTSQAFIKVLDPAQGWATVAQAYAPLVTGQPFSVSLTVDNTPGLVPQYGFVTDGANANPATAEQLGGVLVTTPEPATAALLALGLLLVRRR